MLRKLPAPLGYGRWRWHCRVPLPKPSLSLPDPHRLKLKWRAHKKGSIGEARGSELEQVEVHAVEVWLPVAHSGVAVVLEASSGQTPGNLIRRPIISN